MNFGDGVNVVAFERHSQKRRSKNSSKYFGSSNGLIRGYLGGRPRGKNSKTRLDRHDQENLLNWSRVGRWGNVPLVAKFI